MMKIFVPAFIVTASIIANKNQQAYAANCADTFTGSGSVDAGNTLITKLFVNYPTEFVDLNVRIEKHAAQETTITVGGSFVYDKKKYPKLEAAFAISGSEATVTVGNDVASSGEMMYSSPALPTMWAASTVAAYGLGNNKATYMSGMMIALATFAPDVLAQTATCSTVGELLVTIPKRYLQSTISAASGANVFNITLAPTSSPTTSPTKVPTKSPTTSPTKAPTKSPTKSPTKAPTKSPTTSPTTSSPTTAAPVAANQIFANEWLLISNQYFLELVVPSYIPASEITVRAFRSPSSVSTVLDEFANGTAFSSLSNWQTNNTGCGSTIYTLNSTFGGSTTAVLAGNRNYAFFLLKNGEVISNPLNAVTGSQTSLTLNGQIAPIPSTINTEVAVINAAKCEDDQLIQISCRLENKGSGQVAGSPIRDNYEIDLTPNSPDTPGGQNLEQTLCITL